MRDTTFNVRTSTEIKQLLQQVSSMLGTTVSAFILNSATEKAYELIQNQNHFFLSDKKWEEFCSSLDRQPIHNERVEKLMRQKGVFANE